MRYVLILIIHLSNGQTDEIPHYSPLSLDECNVLGQYYERDQTEERVEYRCDVIDEEEKPPPVGHGQPT